MLLEIPGKIGILKYGIIYIKKEDQKFCKKDPVVKENDVLDMAIPNIRFGIEGKEDLVVEFNSREDRDSNYDRLLKEWREE